jgi:uncharacterized protein with HEPN domain
MVWEIVQVYLPTLQVEVGKLLEEADAQS